MQPSRRSAVVMLSLAGLPVGAVALANLFPGQEMRRNLYPDRVACERDYSPAQCQPNSGRGGVGGGGWHGPYYSANRSAAPAGDPGSGRSGRIAATETSVRGGFGAFGRAAHAGG